MNTQALMQAKQLLSQAESALVLLGAQPTPDQTAAALALAGSLGSAGKHIEIASPNEVAPELLVLPESGIIKQKLGSRDLSISFAYQESAVEKVSYHISEDGQKFFLVVKPQKGQAPLDPATVEYDYTGTEVDIVFLIGIHNLESLEYLYTEYASIFETAPLVVIHTFEPDLGTVKLDTSAYSSYSEAMVALVREMELLLTVEGATQLLAGIETATEGLQSKTTQPETFETVAMLLRMGARRLGSLQPREKHVGAEAAGATTPVRATDATNSSDSLKTPQPLQRKNTAVVNDSKPKVTVQRQPGRTV